MNHPLSVENLSKSYESYKAVKNVSFEVRPGEIFGLLGPNGAGKTSIISCVVTLQTPTAGQVRIFGKDPHKIPLEAKPLVGFVPQEIINHGYFNVEEILQFHSGFYLKQNNDEKIKYLLERLGLYEHRLKKVRALSGGMKRRLLIAKALVHDPKILLLDEPTAGVDIELRNSLWEFVKELRSSGMSVLLTTHYLEEAEQLCDRVGILQKGELKTVGNTRELISQMTTRCLKVWLKSSVTIEHPELIEQKDNCYTFRLASGESMGALINEIGIPMDQIIDLQTEEGSLEEAFIQVLGGHNED